MKKYREYFLNRLLDKYEKSLLYRGENQVQITISLKFNRKILPEYYDSLHYQYKEQINEIVLHLEEKRFIDIIWEKYEEGNLIKQINLNIRKVKDIYQLLNRKEKREYEDETIKILKPYVNVKNYLSQFSQDMITSLQRGQSVSKYLDITNPKQTKNLLYTLDKVLKQKEEVAKRVFSIKLFNDSKYFESIENKVIKIMKDYGTYIDEEHILSEENIVRNPGFVYLKGKGRFRVGKETIDLSLVHGEIAFCSHTIKELEVIELNLEKVITIENLTSFHQYQKENELIIYLGGFHNQIRATFLKKIYDFNQNHHFYHWSDIDLGGFKIYHHLVKKTNIPFIPYLMDKQTLIKYESYTMPIKSKSYLKALKDLLNNDDYKLFKEVISYMINKKIRLEQEIIMVC